MVKFYAKRPTSPSVLISVQPGVAKLSEMVLSAFLRAKMDRISLVAYYTDSDLKIMYQADTKITFHKDLIRPPYKDKYAFSLFQETNLRGKAFIFLIQEKSGEFKNNQPPEPMINEILEKLRIQIGERVKFNG